MLHPRVVPIIGGTAIVAGTLATDDGGSRFPIVPMSEKKIEAHEAWRTDFLVFDAMPLTKVVDEFNRYNRRKLEIADPALANVQMTGRYRPRDVEGFLLQLNAVMKTRVGEQRNAFGDVVALRIHAAAPGSGAAAQK
jgi:transmembrane sensor